MHADAKRYETANPAATRARVATHGFGLMANGSWSIGSCTIVPTTDHKQPPRRPTVIPT